MTMLASVQINQLRLRGDTRTKDALLASLDSQTWPGEDDPRIIFINRLQVKAPWWMLARELAQQSEAEYRAAVAVLQATDASNAVVFASEANLVAQILINLLRCHAPWYQQTWLAQTQLAADLMTVLLYRPVLVPEVLQQLQRQQLLPDFFARCTEADLHTLLTRVQEFLAITPLVCSSINAAAPAHFSVSGSTTNYLPLAQSGWAEHWLPLLLTHTRSPSAQQLVLQLLACFGLWRFSPQQLHTPAAWSLWLAALVEKASAMNLPLANVHRASQPVAPQIPTLSPAATADGLNQSVATSENHNSLSSIPLRSAEETGGEAEIAQSTSENHNSLLSTPLRSAEEIRSEGESADASVAVDYRYIQQAGFLYFINWLRDFDGISTLPAPFSPWLWLALLQRDCCHVWQLPLDESLQLLLLEIGGLSEQDVRESDTGFFAPSLRTAREFLQRRRRDFHLESPDWLAVRARVQLEQAYLQVNVHESAVRLDLRLAGLDLNPGWVPWLGRVIYFHFGQYPELLREHP